MPNARTSPPRRDAAFAQDAARVIAELREATRRLLIATLGREPTGGTDLTKQLALDTTLAWRVARLVGERDDAFAAARFVPGEMALRRLLDAARDAGAPDQACDSFERAAAAFGAFVSERAGSRKTFDLLTEGVRTHTGEKHERELRRSGFHAASFVHGLQAALELTISVMFPSADDHHAFDVAVINGVLGLRQIRSGARWRMGRAYRRGRQSGRLAPGSDWKPLERGGEMRDGEHAMPILRRFSTDPLPRCVVRTLPNGGAVYDLEPNDVGKRDEVDCLTGVLLRRTGFRYNDPEAAGVAQELAASLANFRTALRPRVPSARFLAVFAVHRSLFGGAAPTADVFNNHFAGEEADFETWDRVPLNLNVESLAGPADPRLRDPGFDRLHEALRLGVDASELDPDSFLVHRVQVEFIPAQTTMQLVWPRPNPPA